MSLTDSYATTPQLKVVKGLIDAYLTFDMEKVRPFVTENYTYQMFPKIEGRPNEIKEEQLERYRALFSLVKKTELKIHEVIEDPGRGKVVIHHTAISYLPDGREIENDSLCIVTLVEENGELKVSSFKDFSDPQKRERIHSSIAKFHSQCAA